MLPKKTSKTNTLRRTAALLCAALTGLGLASFGRDAQAAPSGPLTTSPPTPTPFQSPVYHGGGGPTPYPVAASPAAAAPTAAPYLTPLIDPLQGQLQGTPTEVYNGNITQIPSYLLGNYDPTRPPAGLSGGVNTYYPNHFADGGIYSWSAPFSYVSQGAGTVTVDDNAAVPTGAPPTVSGFAFTSGWVKIGDPTLSPVSTYPAAGTATNAEYLRLPAGTPGTATWTLVEPVAGSYSVYFHIPSDLPDSSGNPEVRDTQVVYAISVHDASGNVTATTTATASQTEANDSQFLAGPFTVATGGSVVVTLARSSTPVVINNNADFLVADSMTLQTTIGDVQSAPTVITADLYPNDFTSVVHPLQYWGIYIPPTSATPAATQQTGGSTAAINANPDTTGAVSPPTALSFNSGTVVLKTGIPATPPNPQTVPPTYDLRRIRQLVYFGRSDPAASVSSSVDDSAALPAGTPASGFSGAGVFTPVTNTTASNGEYKRYGTAEGLVAAATPVATWTVPVPTAGPGASFFAYAHIPANPATAPETRLSQVYYRVTVNGVAGPFVAISQITQGTDALVALPTGPLTAAAGSIIVVEMYNANNSSTVVPPTGSVVVADSVTISTGTGQGAIYCVDGFTGGVVWRYQTPGSANGASAPVFASPVITKINVLVTPAIGPTPAVYANRLVAIVGDNNGLVYCLDAIGNGDGTSNANVLNAATGAPITIPQPAYGGLYGAIGTTPLVAGTPATTAATIAHVGTTGVYWVYRPDASRPKFVAGANIGAIKTPDPTTDLPVPAAFATASPNVFVDPTVSTTPDLVTGALKSNAIVYIGNSNGVLYALNALGAGIDTTSAATIASTGDPYNDTQDTQVGAVGLVPTPQPLWWFSLRGVDPNGGGNASSADIESAPAIYVKVTPTTAGAPSTFEPTVYIGSAHEMETTSNVGRLYALNGLYGPSGNNGRSPSDPTATGYALPGSFNYNVGQRPQDSPTDTADWSFPDAVGKDTYTTKSQSSNGKPRPALGNVTGSPVVFTNTDENAANLNADGSPRQTRIFFAASSGYEATTATPTPIARPDEGTTGRLWAVNLDGTVGTTVSAAATTTPTAVPTPTTGAVWSYPLANDPNDAALDTTPEPDSPMGAFLRATPAIGFVQFPATTTNGDGTAYNPADAVNTTGISSKSVPMLYVGSAGVNDTALYALDIDGTMTSDSEGTATGTDTRTIYRVVSPDGSIFQSSPALVTNATNPAGSTATPPPGPGNGGGVYAVAGNTLYDYSATPISNPFTGQAYPLIRENAAFAGFGPISSPALAGANTTDLSTAFLATTPGATNLTNNSAYTTNTTDWVYVGDSSSGLCRGITPNDASYGGIAVGLGSIVPYDPNAPSEHTLDAIIQAFLVDPAKAPTPIASSKRSTDAALIGINAPLQVFEWGESAYVRFTNVAPPNPSTSANPQGDPALYVYDHRKFPDLTAASASNPIPFYRSDGTSGQQGQSVQFNVSDASAGGGSGDFKYVNPQIVATPPDGYVIDAATTPPSFFPDVTTNLQTAGGTRYLGTYTYAIGDGSVLSNTPGARRRFQNVKQKVDVYTFDGTTYTPAGTTIISGDATNENLVSQKTVDPTTGAVTYGFNANSKIAAVDQPTFGILNPLGARGGSVNLLAPGTAAVPIGNTVTGELGPFRSVQAPPTLSTTGGTTTKTTGDNYALQALANGNDVPTVAPPSSSGVGGSPILRPEGVSDPTGVSEPTMTNVIVTTTGEIAHNTTGDNGEPSSGPVTGQYSTTTTDGLPAAAKFGGYALDIFDRSALYILGQTLRLKMTVPTNVAYSPPSGKDGLYWNSNVVNDPTASATTAGHGSVVNFLPWETPPVPYSVGVGSMTNGSQDYPDIAPGNITQIATSNANGASPGDLTSNNITLPQAVAGTGANKVTSRTVTADPVRIQVAVPHYQPANQQLYQQTLGAAYSAGAANQIAPVDGTGVNNITLPYVFPMGYITVKRVYVPDARGSYNRQRPYRDVLIYTGVKVDMRTSVADTSATTDIGKVPAAFGVQTENDPSLGFFTPYNPAFQTYFKPLEIHNDGNVNLLNVHLDQKYISAINNNRNVLFLSSDTVDPLSFLDGYDANSLTGPQNTMMGSTVNQRLTAGGATIPLPGTTANVPEQPYLIRSSMDTDLVEAYGLNPYSAGAYYPSATFHKPIPGGSQPSTLTVPDAPERYVAGASLDNTPNGLPVMPSANGTYKALPYVSLAMPFGTPVGTYSTPNASDPLSVRVFEGIDPSTANAYSLNQPTQTNPIPPYLYPPQYGGAIGGIGKPSMSTPPTDTFQAGQPISTSGTQLIGHVLEQRLTDGATFGAVPMIDAGPAVSNGATPPVYTSTPDFGPAAFRDPATGNLSVYWTSGRNGGFGIYGVNAPFHLGTSATNDSYFYPANPAGQWWQSVGGYTATNALKPVLPLSATSPTYSGLTVAEDPVNAANISAFVVGVSPAAPYSNTLYSYPVTPATAASGAITPDSFGSAAMITPTSSASQVKYGVKGLYTGFTNPLWAFWTGSTRGRTALYYNSQSGSGTNGAWGTTVNLLPVPAGLTAVADASPMLMMAPVNGALASTIEVTYSGTAPDGNIDLYASRYVPAGTTAATASQLNLAAFPPVTENLRAVGGWYQARDVAWSRTGALNVSVVFPTANGPLTTPLLYNGANVPQFTKAIYDKASGLLVLTGVHVLYVTPPAAPAPQFTVNTVYVDAATGRVRFSPALLPTQNFTQIRATFSPEARRLTIDSRADTAPVTFLDDNYKPNDAAGVANSKVTNNVKADRRWTIWRKSGSAGVSGSASLYFKAQRLTLFLPPILNTTTGKYVPIDPTQSVTVSVNGADVSSLVDVDYSRGRIYFPVSTGAEGLPLGTASQGIFVTYTPLGFTSRSSSADSNNTVQWQDEQLANDNAVPPADSAAGLDTVLDYGVPIDTAVNENNVAAFLDPYAGTTTTIGGNSVVTGSHKVWLFWNSTRNGTADIYSETIDPRFAPGP